MWGSPQCYHPYMFLRKARLEFTEQHCARFKSSGTWHCVTGKVACTILNDHTGLSSGPSSSWNKLLWIQQRNFRFHKREETWVTVQLWASPKHCSIMLVNVLLYFIVSTILHMCGGLDTSPLQWPGCVGQSRVQFPAQQQCPRWL